MVFGKRGKPSPPQRFPMGIPIKIAIIEKKIAPRGIWKEGKGG